MERACPRCGRTVWNNVLDWDDSVSFSFYREPVACSACGLIGAFVGTITSDYFAPQRSQPGPALVHIERHDLRIEPLASESEAARVTHVPTGIAVDARSYATSRNNRRAALQALGLQLLDLRQRI